MRLYNEFDPKAAAWLRELIAQGHLSPGEVDTRSIKDIDHIDAETAHFFAGIGGWDYALKLAGWPTERPVWTGSCPCQPFSSAGAHRGTTDPRHLWPDFARLIGECRPPVVFGEQVASPAGRDWLAGVRSDLEGMGYDIGAADLCAAGVGAPHIRQRLYWVGALPNASSARRQGRGRSDLANAGALEPLQHPAGNGRQPWRAEPSRGSLERGCGFGAWSRYDILHFRDGKARRIEPGLEPLAHGPAARVGRLRGYGNAIVPQVAATFIRSFMDATFTPIEELED